MPLRDLFGEVGRRPGSDVFREIGNRKQDSRDVIDECEPAQTARGRKLSDFPFPVLDNLLLTSADELPISDTPVC